jgi:formiminotetrahydrofolate cyclodeaminase
VSHHLSVRDFLAVIRDQPLPGGGSVAALSGALAAALLGKVCRLTLGRPEFAAYDAQTQAALDRCMELDGRFLDLMAGDEEAYTRVLTSYRRPKGALDENQARSEAIQAAWREAIDVPRRIAEACLEIILMADHLVGRSNRTTTADVAMAGNLAFGALETAVIIIKDNLGKVKDEAYAVEQRTWAENLAAKASGVWEGIRLRIDEHCGCTL